ncbi:hypothetical protein BC829DRAFT_401648 [Chytridium lagenaria]|nr:hypothetical protein BC829DRAFT_401648 [Chytridium lagenaria]
MESTCAKFPLSLTAAGRNGTPTEIPRRRVDSETRERSMKRLSKSRRGPIPPANIDTPGVSSSDPAKSTKVTLVTSLWTSPPVAELGLTRGPVVDLMETVRMMWERVREPVEVGATERVDVRGFGWVGLRVKVRRDWMEREERVRWARERVMWEMRVSGLGSTFKLPGVSGVNGVSGFEKRS